MKYKDKATLNKVTSHQNRPEDYGGNIITNRMRERIRKRWLVSVRMIIPDKIWWDSLTDDEKTNVGHEYSNKNGGNFKEIKDKYKGSKEYIRETKLNYLFKD